MGALYKYGLLVAMAQMILTKLHVHEKKYRHRVSTDTLRTSRDSYGDKKIEGAEKKVNEKDVLSRMWGTRSEYTGILDLLIRNSGVDDGDNARVAFRNRKFEFHGFTESERTVCENDDLSLRGELSDLFYTNGVSNNDKNNGNKGEIRNNIELANTDFSISDIITATEDLLEAISVMHLTECYSDPPLINGAALRHVLKNIPKGNVFGEVRTYVCMYVCMYVCVYRHFSPKYLLS